MLVTLTNPPDDSSNHQPIIQAALDAVDADGGGEVFVANGTWLLGEARYVENNEAGIFTLKIGSNTHLRMGPGVRLVRRFWGSNSNPTITNNDPAGGNVHVRVSGGIISQIGNPYAVTNWENSLINNNGKHMDFGSVHCLTIDHVRFEGWTFDDVEYSGVVGTWNVAIVSCNDVVLTGITMNSGYRLREDGLHFISCRRVTVSDCLIICGDDAIAFTQENAPLNLEDMLEAVVTGCVLWSKRANAIKVLIGENETNESIKQIRFSNIVAQIGEDLAEDLLGKGLHIENKGSSQATISDIEIDGLWLDGRYSVEKVATIKNAHRVRLKNAVFYQPDEGLEIEGSTDVELRDVVVDSPRNSSSPCLRVAQSAGCADIRVLGGRFANAGGHGIVLGSSSFSVTRFEVSNAKISEASGSGLYVKFAGYGVATGNTISNCGQWGIEETAPSDINTFLGNFLPDNSSGPIIKSGAFSEAIRNTPVVQIDINDTGGFRQTIDGWEWQDLASGQAAQVMNRANGRFRAVRSGSVTGVVITITSFQQTGSVTATVYKNTGYPGGAGATTTVAATINSFGASRAATVVPIDSIASRKFDPGDELYIVIESNVSWSPTGVDVFCALEIED